MRRHGGEIEAKGRHGGGAQFLLYLPAGAPGAEPKFVEA